MARNRIIYKFVKKNVFLSLIVLSRNGNQLERQARERTSPLFHISRFTYAVAAKRIDRIVRIEIIYNIVYEVCVPISHKTEAESRLILTHCLVET